MANLSFRKNDIDQGITYFKKLFDKKQGTAQFFLNENLFWLLIAFVFIFIKDHYDALYNLIRFLHRAGKLDQAKVFLDKIEKDIPKAPTEPGYNYAKGLFYQ